MSDISDIHGRHPDAAAFADLFVGMDDDDPAEVEAFVADVAGRVRTARSTYEPARNAAPVATGVPAAVAGSGDVAGWFQGQRVAAGLDLSDVAPDRQPPKVLTVEEAVDAARGTGDLTEYLRAKGHATYENNHGEK